MLDTSFCGMQDPQIIYPFTAVFDHALKADKGDAWAAPALQTLYSLRDVLTAKQLADLLPALLRLQGDLQVWPACLLPCMPQLKCVFQSSSVEQCSSSSERRRKKEEEERMY